MARKPPNPQAIARADWDALTEAQRWERAYLAEQEHAREMKRQRDAWRRLAEARSSLLTFYRTGSRPSEKTLRDIDEAEQALGLR